MSVHTNSPNLKDKSVYGVVAEFQKPEDLVAAGRSIHHHHGYKKLDALTPFPIHGIDEAIGVPRSILGYIVFGCGLFGLMNAIFMVWYTNGYDYPLVIGGKPLFAWEFSIPPMFELTVLFSAFGAVFGMLALNGLPKFYHPVFASTRNRARHGRPVSAGRGSIGSEVRHRRDSQAAVRFGSGPHGSGGQMKSALLTIAALLLAGCARQTSRQSPVTFIPDMDYQGRYEPQGDRTFHGGKPIFSDARASLRPVEGTVARGSLTNDEPFQYRR